MNFVLGLDLGTTALKGVLVDSSGRIAASTSEEYPLSSPLPGWSEQDPQDWWLALGRACSRLVTELAPTDKLMAVGLSGQMHGAVFLDRQGNVLHPAILWNDQRTAEQCQQIIDLSGGNIVGWTLNPPRTAFTASKILWLRQHRPEIYERVQHVLLPKDYLRYRLTGSFVTDVSDASGTGLLDVARRQWSQATLDALSIPRSWLPDVVESIDISGRVSADAERATGLAVGTPVVGGAADQTAAAIGNGVTRSGLVSLTLGTSGVVYTQLGDVVVDPSGCFHTFCHAVPETWQMMAGVLSAGGSFRWYRDVVFESEMVQAKHSGVDVYDVISAKANDVPAGAEGLIFLPYLTGERSPHNDPEARGVWIGLTARHRRPHLTRSVLEGVSFAIRDLTELLERLHVPIREVRVAGGGAKNSLWMSILADVLKQPLTKTATSDASAYGAALLAAAHGYDLDLQSLADSWVKTTVTIKPNSTRSLTYDEYYQVYASLYPITKTYMHRLSELAKRTVPNPEVAS